MDMQGPNPAAEEGSAPKTGVQDLVVNIFEQMEELSQALGQSDVLSDEEKSEFAALMSGYQQFVEKLTSAPGEEQVPVGMGRSPEQAAGNKNARPVMM
jgi:hypothetical protein